MPVPWVALFGERDQFANALESRFKAREFVGAGASGPRNRRPTLGLHSRETSLERAFTLSLVVVVWRISFSPLRSLESPLDQGDGEHAGYAPCALRP